METTTQSLGWATALADPNVAYAMFVLGLIGLLTELHHPGLLVPAIAGSLSLAAALVAFGSMPINWGAAALIAIAIGLMVAELWVAGFGALGVTGLALFVAGSLMLFDPSSLQVESWVVATAAGSILAFLLLVLRAAVRTRDVEVGIGIEALLGKEGVAASELAPEGTVRVNNETWTARADRDPIHRNEKIEVIGVEGVTLRVKKQASLGEFSFTTQEKDHG